MTSAGLCGTFLCRKAISEAAIEFGFSPCILFCFTACLLGGDVSGAGVAVPEQGGSLRGLHGRTDKLLQQVAYDLVGHYAFREWESEGRCDKHLKIYGNFM